LGYTHVMEFEDHGCRCYAVCQGREIGMYWEVDGFLFIVLTSRTRRFGVAN
jgi:hypothetical protein